MSSGLRAMDVNVAFCLAVLDEARKGAELGGRSELWEDFKKTHDVRNINQNSRDIALWVGNWWSVNRSGITLAQMKVENGETPPEQRRKYLLKLAIRKENKFEEYTRQ